MLKEERIKTGKCAKILIIQEFKRIAASSITSRTDKARL
jgi:hypothetical protein